MPLDCVVWAPAHDDLSVSSMPARSIWRPCAHPTPEENLSVDPSTALYSRQSHRISISHAPWGERQGGLKACRWLGISAGIRGVIKCCECAHTTASLRT